MWAKNTNVTKVSKLKGQLIIFHVWASPFAGLTHVFSPHNMLLFHLIFHISPRPLYNLALWNSLQAQMTGTELLNKFNGQASYRIMLC